VTTRKTQRRIHAGDRRPGRRSSTHKVSGIIDTIATSTGAKRQEDMTTQGLDLWLLLVRLPATPGLKNDLSPITPPRQAIYGALVGRETSDEWMNF